MSGLTYQQDKALHFIASRRVCPSFREIQAHLGLSSVSNVARIIDALVERGQLRRLPERARCLEIISRLPTEADFARYTASDLEALRVRLENEAFKRARPHALGVAR